MVVCHVAKEVVRLEGLPADLGTGLAVTSDRFRRQPRRSRAHAKPCFPSALQHIAIQYHFTRELVQKEHLIVKYIPKKAMVADALTSRSSVLSTSPSQR